jgi:hypothetical protein
MDALILKIVYLRKGFINMNRLVIIGNGFDLAHGLPTSYKDFIDDYWNGVTGASHDDDFVSFENLGQHFKFDQVKNLEGLANFIMQYDEKIKFSEAEIYREYGNNNGGKYPRKHILNYKNPFFRLINQKAIQNWVDIENEYYRELKKIINSKCLDVSKSEEFWENEQKNEVQKLNKEFDEIKNLLEKYLKEKVVEKFNFDSFGNDNFIKFYNIFYPDLLDDKFIGLKDAFSDEDKLYIDKILEEGKQNDIKLHFLCFNYTPTIAKYVNSLRKKNNNIQLNFIHGEIDNIDDNKINFGFGDEMDEDYKLIENLNDNEYLKNFKSFQYLQNSNYKKLLDFIDNDKYEVLIMGHSCGLSDRTLLNTIFENLNCSLIRVFYYQWEDKATKEMKDNYIELTQNISRHFNDKKVMRKKIANKTFCEPMPRNKLPLKKMAPISESRL